MADFANLFELALKHVGSGVDSPERSRTALRYFRVRVI